MNANTVLAGIVVDESNRLQVELRVMLQFAGDIAPRPPGPNNQSIELSCSLLRTLGIRANRKTGAPYQEHCEGQINRKDRSGIAVNIENHLNRQKKNYCACERCLANIQRITHSDVTPPSTEKAKRVEDEQLDCNNQR